MLHFRPFWIVLAMLELSVFCYRVSSNQNFSTLSKVHNFSSYTDDIPLDRPHPADVALSFTLLAQAVWLFNFVCQLLTTHIVIQAIYREDRSGAAQHLRQALQADPCCVEAFRLMKRGGLVSGSEIRADLLQLDVSPDRAWVSDIFCCLADPCASTSSGMPPAAAADALTHHLILACTAYDSRDWNTTVLSPHMHPIYFNIFCCRLPQFLGQ
jgi:hypothetical protein